MNKISIQKKLLLVDDDKVLRERLGQALRRRGYDVVLAAGREEALQEIEADKITHALLDLRLDQENGLVLVEDIRAKHPACKIVMMTGYGNIATAVAAIKAGAVDYIAKPIDVDMIEAAFSASSGLSPLPQPAKNPMSPDRLRWEYILRIYEQCGRNLSETARQLQMHRRTLQRIMKKNVPHEDFGPDEAD
jgi:two-component system, response regulator RegA